MDIEDGECYIEDNDQKMPEEMEFEEVNFNFWNQIYFNDMFYLLLLLYCYCYHLFVK